MKIGGIIPFTLADFPGRPAAVVFTAGCNLRCPFCHNPELVSGSEAVAIAEVLAFLAQRAGRLKGVCVSGGEPTLHPGLREFLVQVKELGYAVKLDTNGTAPEHLAELLQDGLVDYTALDVKTSPAKYDLACGGSVDPDLVAASAAGLRQFGGEYELRTTAVPGLVELADIAAVGSWLGAVPRYALQQFRPGKTLDPQYGLVAPHELPWFRAAAQLAGTWAAEVVIRGT